MSILLRIERESGGQSIELGDGQITGYSYINTSPADFFAKAYNADHSIQIRGEIPLRLLPPVEQDADNSNTLYAWALTEYRPDNDYYRSVTVQIVRHEKTIREVKFTHAYVHVYQEQVNGLKGILEFELVVRQRRDQLDSIQFGKVELINRNFANKKEKHVTILSNAPKIESFSYKDKYKGSQWEPQKGDEDLSLDKQVALHVLSVLYNAVDGLDNAKSIQDLLHETAKDVRTNDYFAVNGKFGTGLEAKLMLLGVGAQVGFKEYYEDVYTSTPKLTIEAAVGIHLSNEVFLGAEGKASKNAETDVPIPDSRTAFLGLKVGSHKLGWGEIPKSDKFILESALGAYTPLGGGEISLEINLSSIGKAIADSIKNYKTADDCFCSDGTPGTVTDAVFGQKRPVTLPDVIILK